MVWPTLGSRTAKAQNRNYYSRQRGDSLLNDTRCYFNVRSKTDTSQLNLPAWMDNINMACNALCEPYAMPELNVVHVLATIPTDRRKKLLFLTDTI